ncbi:protein eyes shut isoform X2 [Drosophila sechellia]|uniref:protein eyes shut isoform X2 n=1 Tax=Drosophila sechellia TaxID=7238 RepID=UPI0013DE54F0|nr:protein eyes shut isoform X2 [Drosophila sechellia]
MSNVHQFDTQTMAESPQIRRDMGRPCATLPSKDSEDGAGTALRAATPLTANGATTTGLSVTLAPKDMQRNHLLKMPTATIEKPTITATIASSSTSTTRKSVTATRSQNSNPNILLPTLRILARGLLLPALIVAILVGSSQAGFACLSNPCVFGVCIDGLNSSYSCYCIDGYTGIQCQTNWDECWSSPCQNGGTCVDGVAYYNCTCPEGFSGSNCEENVDECMSNPCQNGGLCRDRTNGYICTCQPGYLGSHCELDVAVCETGTGARCQHGGECIEGPGLEFTCDCPAGWHGRICQEEINECASSPCQNGGVCVDKLAAYACACPMGYTGINCEEEILICADNPCQNNALCLMEEGVPTCYCVPDYHGEKCEFQYDECQLGPRCMNGGVCIDGVDTFSCSCPPLLTGMLCECLMVGEESLDCNYTAPATQAPPRRTTTTSTMAPPTVRPVTPPETTVSPSRVSEEVEIIVVTTSAPTEVVTSVLSPSSSSSSSEEGVSVEIKTPTVAPPESDSHSISVEQTTAVPAQPEPESEQEPEPKPHPESESASESETETEEEIIPGTTSRPPASRSSSSSEESPSIFTTLPPLPGKPQTSASSESSGEVVTSEEYTTVPHFEVSGSKSESGSEEVTTVRPTAAPSITISVDITSPGSSSSSSESVEVFTTPAPVFVQRVTTIETTISIDYVTPTPLTEDTTRRVVPVPRPTFAPEPPLDVVETTASTHHLWTEVPTTAAPFFTEYPAEVLITTHRTSAGRFTTVQPPAGVTTTSPTEDSSVELPTPHTPQIVVTILDSNEAIPSLITTTGSPTTHHHHHHHPHHEAEGTTLQPLEEDEHHHHHHHHDEFTTPQPVEITTEHPLQTEDLIGVQEPAVVTTEAPFVPAETTVVPVVVPATIAPLGTAAPPATVAPVPPGTTAPPPPTPSLATEPPTLPPTLPPVTLPPVTLPPPTIPPTPPSTQSAQTLPPPTSAINVYTTPDGPPTASQTKPSVTESSEEVEGANTVSTGGRGSGGVPEEKAGDVDCIKLGCYNGGTCVTTSEGSRCVCRFDRQGPLCELPIIIRNAAFSGDSYVSHRIYKDIGGHESLDAVLPMHIQLKVRTRATNGLIMLAAAQGTKGGHYMALFLQKGLMQFQFSCGLQTMLLSELETPVNTGHEITIRAEHLLHWLSGI